MWWDEDGVLFSVVAFAHRLYDIYGTVFNIPLDVLSLPQ